MTAAADIADQTHKEAIRIARILARRDGLGAHMPDSSLKGWMGHADVMVGYIRERVADAYKLASGKAVHASDCATSNAPAMEPGPCDCEGAPELLAVINGLIEMAEAYGLAIDARVERARAAIAAREQGK